jgi:hypothetical protein
MRTRREAEAKVPNVPIYAVVAMLILLLPSCSTLKDGPVTEQIGDHGATVENAPHAVKTEDEGCDKALRAPQSANPSNRQPASEPGSVPYGVIIGH